MLEAKRILTRAPFFVAGAALLAGCGPHQRSSHPLTAPPAANPDVTAMARPAVLPSTQPSGSPSTTPSTQPSGAPGERPGFPEEPGRGAYGKSKPLPMSAQKPMPLPEPTYAPKPKSTPAPWPTSVKKPMPLPPPSAQRTSPYPVSAGPGDDLGDGFGGTGERAGERPGDRTAERPIDRSTGGFEPSGQLPRDPEPRSTSRPGDGATAAAQPNGGSAPGAFAARPGEPGRTARRVLGESCAERPSDARRDRDRGRDEASERPICLAVSYVVYRDDEGRPVQSAPQIARGLERVNRIWSRCGIAFQIERAGAIDPERYGLNARTRDYPELTDIRKRLSDDERLLVVATGDWDRRGSIGWTGANAWTNLPGEGLYGAILERSVSANPQMLAHELGHYLGLGHQSRPEDLMHPLISGDSERLHSGECSEARETALREWRAMQR